MSKHRATAGGIHGYAVRWNSDSVDLGGYTETVRSGAFTASLADGADVKALRDHDPSKLLGRNTSGTLQLTEDAVGLRFECAVSDTTAGRDAIASVARNDLTQMSFAFVIQPNGERWYEGPNGELRRELTKLSLLDVTLTASPAYPETSVSQD